MIVAFLFREQKVQFIKEIQGTPRKIDYNIYTWSEVQNTDSLKSVNNGNRALTLQLEGPITL